MIEAKHAPVEIKKLVRHSDERGFFQEIIRGTDLNFVGFGQWSMSQMNEGTIKAWHIHKKQYDYWFVVRGQIKAAVCDLRGIKTHTEGTKWFVDEDIPQDRFQEFLLGEQTDPQVLVIPNGVAHGLKVLQSPAVLMYITSRVYDPQDEGRLPYDALPFDWLKKEYK